MEYINSVYHEASEIYPNRIILDCEEEEIHDTLLENIINNAIKYGSRDSPVTLKVTDTEKFVNISVHNTGNPIPVKKQKEIFNYLSTTNDSRSKNLRSWGMGLALVKKVAEAHGGQLELVSNEEEGTTFSISLHKFGNKPGKIRTTLNFEYNGSQFEEGPGKLF